MDAGKQTFALERVKMTPCKSLPFGVHDKIFQQFFILFEFPREKNSGTLTAAHEHSQLRQGDVSH